MSTHLIKTKAILMLHGGPGFYGYMHTLGDQLPKHHQVTYFAQRGSLANPKPYTELTLDAHMKDIDDIVLGLPNEQKLCLMGHSWGANLALLYAALHPDKIHKVVIFCPAPLTLESAQKFEANLISQMAEASQKRFADLKQAMLEALQKDDPEGKLNSLANERFNLALPFYHFHPAAREKIVPIPVDFRSFIASQDALWQEISSGSIPECLTRVKAPVLLIQGAEDPIPYQEIADYLREHLAKLTLEVHSHCGHFPWLEPAAKEASIASCISFLDSE